MAAAWPWIDGAVAIAFLVRVSGLKSLHMDLVTLASSDRPVAIVRRLGSGGATHEVWY